MLPYAYSSAPVVGRSWTVMPLTMRETGGAPAAGASPGIIVGPDGSVYVVEAESHRIRRIAPDGTITAFAGTGVVFIGMAGLRTIRRRKTV